MERLTHMEETLMSCVEGQLGHLDCVDTHELGEAIDMIKDLAQAKYYCSIVKAMEEADTSSYYRDMDRTYGRMYYEGPDGDFRGRQPWAREYPRQDYRDSREGRSPISRKMYMESKQLHREKSEKIKELEKYMQELTDDIVEMIEDASPEERNVLHTKMTHLTNKIA